MASKKRGRAARELGPPSPWAGLLTSWMGGLGLSASSFVKWRHEYRWPDVNLTTRTTVDSIWLIQRMGHITIYWWTAGTKCGESGPKEAGRDSKDLKSLRDTPTYSGWGGPASLLHRRADPAEALTGCSCDILKGCLMAVPSVIKQQIVYYCSALSLFLVGAWKGRACQRMMYGPQN